MKSKRTCRITILKRSIRFIPTNNDWSPSFFQDGYEMVEGTVMIHHYSYIDKTEDYFIRICFWGNDDSGIEYDKIILDKEEAFDYYESLLRYLNGIILVDRIQLLRWKFFPA